MSLESKYTAIEILFFICTLLFVVVNCILVPIGISYYNLSADIGLLISFTSCIFYLISIKLCKEI